jgi:hypothetical protein
LFVCLFVCLLACLLACLLVCFVCLLKFSTHVSLLPMLRVNGAMPSRRGEGTLSTSVLNILLCEI